MMNKKAILGLIILSMLFAGGFIYGQGGVPAVKLEGPQGIPTTFPGLLENIIEGVGGVIASLGTIIIIIAGILYLTSAGNEQRMTKAKTALVYAIAGIAIGLAARIIPSIIKSIVT